MRPLTLLSLLAFLPGILLSQVLHTPREVIERMSDSKVTYTLESLEKWNSTQTYAKVNDYFTHPEEVEGEISIEHYELGPYGKRSWQLAEEAMQKEDLSAARENYKLVIQNQPDYAPAYTAVGLTFSRQGDRIEAIRYFEQAIEINFFDYLAHWSLALSLWEEKKKEKAAQEIAIAWVLNRNEPRLEADVKRIFKTSGRKLKEWNFDPQCTIQKLDKEIKIASHADWMPYAMVKALWKFEPGYAEEMGGPQEWNTTEEREALFNLILLHTDENGKVISKDPAIQYLWKAMEDKFLIEYIIFEIWLRQEPLIAFTQPKEAVLKLATYVLSVRGSQP
ncbi:MAG: hypothetical protein H6581_27030 [Bacteroidia bacterium]|nr:hypothetical protein [Bacteroidia bacterium]